MTFEFKHPNYYKKLKRENRLTNKEKYGKENDNEKIQNQSDGQEATRKQDTR